MTSGTLTGGSYTVGGTLQLTSTNGGITTNADHADFDRNLGEDSGRHVERAGWLQQQYRHVQSYGGRNVDHGEQLHQLGHGGCGEGQPADSFWHGSHVHADGRGKTTLDGTLGGIPGGRPSRAARYWARAS